MNTPCRRSAAIKKPRMSPEVVWGRSGRLHTRVLTTLRDKEPSEMRLLVSRYCLWNGQECTQLGHGHALDDAQGRGSANGRGGNALSEGG